MVILYNYILILISYFCKINMMHHDAVAMCYYAICFDALIFPKIDLMFIDFWGPQNQGPHPANNITTTFISHYLINTSLLLSYLTTTAISESCNTVTPFNYCKITCFQHTTTVKSYFYCCTSQILSHCTTYFTPHYYCYLYPEVI